MSHGPSPPRLTHPWQSPLPAPEPVHRPPAQHAPLGHHSDLRLLRAAYRWQRRVATLTALGCFVLFLVLSAFAPSLMTSQVGAGLPLGLVLALVQLPVTWLAIALYESTARRRVDPLADRIRKQSVYGLFWRRYTRSGLLCTLIGGTLSVLVLLPGTNLVSGSPVAAFPDADFNWFPYTTTAMVTVPLGFALGWLGTLASGRRKAEEQRHHYEAVEGWILAGAVRRGD
ncbi:DUF485 domain-containing protein [Streptomyces bobili]|uniref:DUF485 domain-containing protein n=1 Tax=Streptomyces bobili TaxID=67280 RepID=UPI003F541C18